jgi:TPP-dependent 2-oxoacid decarboxylase
LVSGVARPSDGYHPRAPAQSVLYQIVRDHLETFRAQTARVWRQVAAFLREWDVVYAGTGTHRGSVSRKAMPARVSRERVSRLDRPLKGAG